MTTMRTGVAVLDSTDVLWKRRINAPSADEGGVVPGIDLTAMLHDAANDVIARAFDAADLKSLSKLAIRPVLRSLSSVFEAPLEPETPVFIGVTLGSLSRRSFDLTTGMWMMQSQKPVAYGCASFVVIDVTLQKAVAVPEKVADHLRGLRPACSTSQPSKTAADRPHQSTNV